MRRPWCYSSWTGDAFDSKRQSPISASTCLVANPYAYGISCRTRPGERPEPSIVMTHEPSACSFKKKYNMKCFVIMPIGDFNKDAESAKRFEHIYTHWIKTAVEDLQSAHELGRIGCHRADKDNRPGDIIAQVIEALSDADFVIADLTGRNPNVFYELGVRHALRNNTILIAQDIDDIPFDLRGQRTICYRYDPQSLIELKLQLQASLSAMLG